MVQRVQATDLGGSDLLFLLAEELKQPLINISHLAELGDKDVAVRAQAKKALHTIDSVVLYRRLVSGQLMLHPEPVHVGSTIVGVASTIESQMRMSGCRTELAIQPSLQPVDIDRRLLSSALLGMWQAFISSIEKPQDIVCSAHTVPNGIRLSVVSEGATLEGLALSIANTESSQPIVGFAGSATDLITAHRMFELVGSKVTKSRRGSSMVGLGVTLPVSKQMQLV